MRFFKQQDPYYDMVNIIFTPINSSKSKANCDKLLYFYCKLQGKYHDNIPLDKIINKTLTGDLFNDDFKVPKKFNTNQYLISSGIQTSSMKLFDIFYSIFLALNSVNPNVNTNIGVNLCNLEIELYRNHTDLTESSSDFSIYHYI
jgi:hypothetical protein